MKVKLLNATPNATELIYKAYRVCYSKYTYDEIKVPSQADMEEFIKDKMDKQHFSPLEHVNFTFYIEGISRACLAQLTRHRTFKFNCVSQRYVDAENFDFIKPDLSYITDDYNRNEATMGFKYVNEHLLGIYKELISLGVKKEDARGVLPNNTTCSLMVTCDLRNLRNFLSQRLCNHAQAEIKKLAHNMCLIAEEHFPLTKYRVMNCDRCNGCKGVNINE